MLDLNYLRERNVHRCITEFKHKLDSWSVAEWTNAMAGEAGEACNVAKKLIRIRDGVDFLNKGVTGLELMRKLGEEVADTVIYADLVLASRDMSLAEEIVRKFNKDSEERGLLTILRPDRGY